MLRRNKRLRVYAREVDREGLRIKLTCKRPRSLPRCGPAAAAALASDADAEEFDYDDTARVRYTEDDGWDRDDEDDEMMAMEEDEMDEFDDDEFDGDEGEEWFYPDRGQVIPAPEADLAPRQ